MKVSGLVKRAQGGDKKALLKLIITQKTDYYRLAYTYMGNEPDAMDAVSEMTVVVYEKIADLRKRDAFYTWSKTILVNCCKRMLKNRKKLIMLDDWMLKDAKQNVTALWIEIESLLAVLSVEQKEAILLKYIHDLDYKTVAKLTGVSVGTAKTRVHYGMKKLREEEGRLQNG